MASFNKVILIGHLTADPELKQTNSGTTVTTFNIGVSRRYAKSGEQTSDFINIVAWKQNAEFVCKYFSKGSAILICGRLETRSYEAADGSKRYIAEVVADEVNFAERKSTETPAASKVTDLNVDNDDGHLPF